MEKQEFIKKIAALVKKYAGLYGIPLLCRLRLAAII